jgi:PAS domain S-box-containing protein
MAEHDDVFRDLCENANDLIQSVATDGQVLYVNRTWLETLGYTPEEAPHLNIFDIIHPDSRDHCQSIFQELLAGKEQVRIEAEFQTKDGLRIPVEGNVTCKYEDDRPVATRGIFRDLRERRRAREELDRLFNLSQDMMCIAGTDGFFKQINPAFERVLGYSESELLSVVFLDFVHPEDRDKTVQEVEQLAQGQATVDFENRYLAKDGEYRWMEWRATPVPESGLIYAVARDVTDQKRVQTLLVQQTAELARSNADLEVFAYAASHDLRSPLRSVSKIATWIEEDLGGEISPKLAGHLEKLRTRVGRMDDLIDELLEYSKAGNKQKTVERIDTATTVRELVDLMGPREGMQIVAEGMPTLETAGAPLQQVLRNLIDNALKHHDGAVGRIVVAARKRGDFYEFSVTDDGPGIPEEDRERIFGTFEKGRATEEPGHGLGLALVRRLVETYGGTIRAEAARPRGAVFRFTWPMHMAATENTDADHPGR